MGLLASAPVIFPALIQAANMRLLGLTAGLRMWSALMLPISPSLWCWSALPLSKNSTSHLYSHASLFPSLRQPACARINPLHLELDPASMSQYLCKPSWFLNRCEQHGHNTQELMQFSCTGYNMPLGLCCLYCILKCLISLIVLNCTLNITVVV